MVTLATFLMLCAFFANAAVAVNAPNGYVASFSLQTQVLGTRARTLDPGNVEIARLAAGFTISMWLRFRDPGKPIGYSFGAPFSLLTWRDANFMQPFAGNHGGFELGSQATPTVRLLGDKAREWHQYAVSWNASVGVLHHYIDGQPVGTPFTRGAGSTFLEDDAFLTLGLQCMPTKYYAGAEYTSCQAPGKSMFDGDMDDVAIFAGTLSANDIRLRWNSSLTNRIASGLEPSLVLFWNFNHPLASPGWIHNLGTAGADYDLQVGSLPKQSCESVFGTSFTDPSGALLQFELPRFVPGPAALVALKEADVTAPFVQLAAPGETISVAGHAGSPLSTYTAPAAFNATAQFSAVDAAGNNVSIHVVPLVPPSVPTLEVHLTHTGGEDRLLWIKLRGSTTSGMPLTMRITQLTSEGTLYDVPTSESTSRAAPILAAGQSLNNTSSGYLLYVPHRNAFGTPHDVFAYTASLDAVGLTSPATTVTISLDAENDLPTAAPVSESLVEDANPDGVLLRLEVSDAEYGTPLDVVVSTLPEKGRLFQTSDGTLAGARTPILERYNLFDVGEVIQQYAERVIAVSSFWGGPPYPGYHPLTILGPPDCRAYGECADDSPWVCACIHGMGVRDSPWVCMHGARMILMCPCARHWPACASPDPRPWPPFRCVLRRPRIQPYIHLWATEWCMRRCSRTSQPLTQSEARFPSSTQKCTRKTRVVCHGSASLIPTRVRSCTRRIATWS